MMIMASEVSVERLQTLRVVGAVKVPGRLTMVERERLEQSWRRYRRQLSRCAWRYYGGRCDDVADAAAWLMSETYTYVIESVVSGSRPIPTTRREWFAVAAAIRHRYYAANQIVIDGGVVRLLGGDDDSTTITRLTADRLQLDDDAFAQQLRTYAAVGLAVDDCPAWCAETIDAWLFMADATYAERAEAFGLSIDGWRTRETRTRAAIRAGIHKAPAMVSELAFIYSALG